jgi:hypothetical protein
MAHKRTVPSVVVVGWLLQASGCSTDSDSQTPNVRTADAVATTALRLNEIRLLPAENAPVFIELANTGSEVISLAGGTLKIEGGATVQLPQGIAIEPGAWLVVSFDDQPAASEGVVHRPATDFTGGESGSIRLELPAGLADAVAWGEPNLGSASLCRGGRCEAPAPGSVLARLPDRRNALAPSAWAPLDATLATPGESNPRPPVTTFAAIPGMIFTDEPRFSWYSVPGAVRYRLEVVRGNSLVHVADVEATPGMRLEQLTAYGPELPPGDYAWRVQALGSAGESAEFSPPMPFTVDPTRVVPAGMASLPTGDSPEGAAGSNAAPPPAEELLRVWDVPVIRHAKDTAMLSLEAPTEATWDKPNVGSYPYCARAAVAMVNAFYKGKLSQDRIAYEVFLDLRERAESDLPRSGSSDERNNRGPEYDLPIFAISDRQTHRYSLPFAIGTNGELVNNIHYAYGEDRNACGLYIQEQALAQCASLCADERSNECFRCRIARERELDCPTEIAHPWGLKLIEVIQTEINAGRPMIATTSGHMFLIVGYRLRDGRFSFFYQDEGGRREVPANAAGFTKDFVSYWRGLAAADIASDEREVSLDSDDDDVVDFDEIHRFRTDELKADSDGDGLRDKDEIRASVWDPLHGYHRSVAPDDPEFDFAQATVAGRADLAGRDFDRDGVAMEVDSDSDGGGCRDGQEDTNLNAARDGSETYNFDGGDDDCEVSLGGRIEMSYGFIPSQPPDCKGNVSIRLRFELDPWWGTVPEAARPVIPHVFRASEAQYEISSEGCTDIVGGAHDFWGGANVACNAPPARKSGVVAIGPETTSDLSFFPLDPRLHLVFPVEAMLGLDGVCVYVDGSTSAAPIELVGREVLAIGSGPTCATNERHDYGTGPELLEFCVEPGACNAYVGRQVLECFTQPERFAQIPFSGSLSKQGAILEGRDIGGNAFPIPIDGAQVRWEICAGCGDRFLE